MWSTDEDAPVKALSSPIATAGAALSLGPLVERVAESDEEMLNDTEESLCSSIMPI